MASADGPTAEFDDLRRQELLKALQDALSTDIRPTAWACLWLSDMEKLEDIVSQAQERPTMVLYTLSGLELDTQLVPQCTLLAFILFNC
jgi:hypothetical protein